MTAPTDGLREEHTLILRALDLLEAAVERGAPPAWWDDALAWLRTFADRNHHGKEEQALFPALIKAGVPSPGGPVDVMLEEHTEGRTLVHAMAAATTPAARARAARAYVALLRAHIDKENGILLPLADAVLDEQGLAAVRQGFETVEAEEGRWAVGAEPALGRLQASLGS